MRVVHITHLFAAEGLEGPDFLQAGQSAKHSALTSHEEHFPAKFFQLRRSQGYRFPCLRVHVGVEGHIDLWRNYCARHPVCQMDAASTQQSAIRTPEVLLFVLADLKLKI